MKGLGSGSTPDVKGQPSARCRLFLVAAAAALGEQRVNKTKGG